MNVTRKHIFLSSGVLLFAFAQLLACVQSADNSSDHISPFKISMTVHYYPTLISLSINLTSDSLKIIRFAEKDSILVSNALNYSDDLKSISEINFNGLQNSYSNSCFDDGFAFEVLIEKDGFKKTVLVENYYQNEIGQIIQFVNAFIPANYRIWYDKEQLTKDYENCKAHEKL